MAIHASRTDNPCSGFVVFIFMLTLSVLLTSLAFAVDVGRAHEQRQQLQNVADAAALAAVGTLGVDTDYPRMMSVVTSIAVANGASVDEIIAIEPRCGIWEDGMFKAGGFHSCTSSMNAVEVSVTRSVPTAFARLMSQGSFQIRTSAIAYNPPPIGGSCIRPFGIEQSALENVRGFTGETFSVAGTQEVGNWGKLDIIGNSSSGVEYTRLMLTNLCDESITAGGYVSSGTGSAQIDQVFQSLLDDTTPPLAARNMVFAVTPDARRGNSTVQILRFIKVDFLGHGGSGPRWRADFRIVEWDAQPDPPVQPTRRLVK
jgi:hypothetical protein